MFCSSCGKEIPDVSSFCYHCGAKVGIPTVASTITSTQEVAEWEYQDFVHTFPHKTWYVEQKNWSNARVGLEVWQKYQSQICFELQKFLDDGWQPVGEVGPSSIRVESFQQFEVAYLIFWGVIFPVVGLLLAPFCYSTQLEPTECRIPIRRPKR